MLTEFLKKYHKIGRFNPETLLTAKRAYSKLNGEPLPTNAELLAVYINSVNKAIIKPDDNLYQLLRLKKIRTLSGVAPVAVLTKPYPCPGKCVYCPTQKGMPKSYLADEPAVLRANALDFDACLQVKARIGQYEAIGHVPQKIELIVMGGTWSFLPQDYRIRFITDCYRACNEFAKGRTLQIARSDLKQEQTINETAKYRIVGLTLETRPDYINEEEIKFMRMLGCTRVELGVQSVDDKVLEKVNRGHTVQATVKATKLLRNAGFKICYHMMPNLPGSNPEKDLEMFKTIYADERFKPDMVKIYPCVVTSQAELFSWYKQGKFTPYSDKELIELLIKIKQLTPEWVRINRLGRDIPVANIEAGFKISNIRQLLKTHCQCIRCREAKNSVKQFSDLKFKCFKFRASQGDEYFMQYVDSDNKLYSLLRLRLGKKAIIREVHTYGIALAVGERSNKTQHQGLGIKLIAKAEKIAKENNFYKISVISGIGVKDYYRHLGYKSEGTYMVKLL